MGQIIFFFVFSLFILSTGGLIIVKGRLKRDEIQYSRFAPETEEQDFFTCMIVVAYFFLLQ